MKTTPDIKYPNGTTKEQWDKYYEELKKHEEYMERIKPERSAYGADMDDTPEYTKALNAWHMRLFCDAPNKPGYYRANND